MAMLRPQPAHTAAMEDATYLGCPRARSLLGDEAGGEAAAGRQPRSASPPSGSCSHRRRLLALRQLHSPPGRCSRAIPVATAADERLWRLGFCGHTGGEIREG
jgi:hypothetical protein